VLIVVYADALADTELKREREAHAGQVRLANEARERAEKELRRSQDNV
jgi:hypothetical protein